MSPGGAWAARTALGLLGLSPLVAQAQLEAQAVPMSVQARFDPAHIEGGERLGLLSTALLFEATPGWWLGPVVVGAATGQRGGFFVLGGQIERRWRLADQWRAQVGLMAGGGGGAGAPVGGGLMVQPSASLLYDWGPVQTGVSWSRVNMPSGQIGSPQWGLIVNWDGRFPFFDATHIGRSTPDTARSGLGLDRLSLNTDRVRWDALDGRPAGSMRLVGVRAEQQAGQHAYWGVEAAAATHGGADGYMELLGTLGWETSAAAWGLAPLRVGVRGALGLGGGGAVETGGGVLGKAAGVLRWQWHPDVFVGLEAGAVRSAGGGYRARYAQLQLGMQLDHPGRAGEARVVGMDWAASLQHVTRAARKDGSVLALDTMGIKVRRQAWEQVYLTGQAHSAFAGRAGAYSMGLAGVGWGSTPGHAGWSLGAELMAGAAGGGGVATQGGAVAQAMVYAGRSFGAGSLQLGAGRIRSQRGDLNSPVLDISWNLRFGLGQR